MSFDLIENRLNQDDEKLIHRHEFILLPRMWQEYPSSNIYTWEMKRLVAGEKRNIPDHPGVYTLLIQPAIAGHPACSFLMYVGRAKSLQKRFGNYLNQEKKLTGRPKIFRLLHRYPQNTWFCYVQLAAKDNYSEWDLYQAELALYSAYLPPCNDMLPARPAASVPAFPEQTAEED